MTSELYELEAMREQDEALPEQGFADVVDTLEGDMHRIGLYDDGAWLEYEISVEDVPQPQKSDVNVLMAELERRYE